MRGIVLAAGKGTRMQGLSDFVPKPLLPLANIPALVRSLQNLRAAGIKDVLVVIGHNATSIQNTIGDGSCLDMRVEYAVQEEQCGTGDAVMLAQSFASGQAFVAMYGDVVFGRDNIVSLLSSFRESSADAVMTVYPVREAWRGGVVLVERNEVVAIIEKPKPGTVDSDLINAGVYVFPPEIFDALGGLEPSERGEIELTDGVRKLLERGCRFLSHQMSGFWENLTDPASYLAANSRVLQERAALKESLIHAKADIDRDATLAGTVAVGEGCEIGKATVGPSVSIGNRCKVEDGAELSNCILLEGSRVATCTVVKDAVIGPGVEVRENTQASNPSDPPLLLPRKRA